jgi:anti-sigma factor RsiW
MVLNPVCRTFISKLSPFIDGELRAGERVQVESHLATCGECARRVAALRAESALIRDSMELLIDDVDLRDFSKNVMARIAPARVPFLERWGVSLRELFTYRRGMMISLVGASAAIVVFAPILLRGGPQDGYASERMAVQAVSTDPEAHVAPVVMSGERGNAIIWLVSHKHVMEGTQPAAEFQLDDLGKEARPEQPKAKINQERPHGGEL